LFTNSTNPYKVYTSDPLGELLKYLRGTFEIPKMTLRGTFEILRGTFEIDKSSPKWYSILGVIF